MSDTLRINNLFTTAIAYSTLTGSTMTSNSLVLSTLTVSSINSGAPGVAAYSTFNASSINATSTITGSTINALTGRMGIGTSAPAQALDIVNSASATMGVRLQNQFSAGYLSMGAVVGVNSYIGLQAGASTTSALTTPTLCVTNANNVGIGTANPGHPLDINGSSTVLARFQSTADFARIVLDGPSGGDIIYKVAGVSRWGIACIGNHLQFLLNDSPSTVPVTFTSGGNVGIGNTTPYGLFNLHSAYVGSGIFPTQGLTISTTNGTPWQVGAIIGYIAANTGGSTSGFPGGLAFQTKPADSLTTSNLITRMVIDSNGYVGIGITNPGYLLDVNGTLNIRGSFTVNGVAVATGTGSVWTVGESNAIFYSAGNTCLFRNRLVFSNAINDFNHSIYNNGFNVDSEGAWDGMKFNVYAGAWFRTGNVGATTSVFMNTSGYVGIGTTTVAYPLTVWSSGPGYSTGGNNPYIISPTISVQNTAGYGIVSGWFQKDLIAGGAVGTFSDLRIKNNVHPVTNALETIDRLNMVSHGYIDHVQNRQSCSFGLIAQQVKHIVPDAVLLTTDYIPNIMCAPLTAALDGDHIILTFDHPIDLAVNDLLRFILKDRQVEQKVAYVSQDQTVIHVSVWSNPDLIHDQVFVYGKQVDDFHILDKPKMGLLALAGVKELMKQNAEQAEKITTLESQLATVLARLSAAGIA
jgi:hypothetical protein